MFSFPIYFLRLQVQTCVKFTFFATTGDRLVPRGLTTAQSSPFAQKSAYICVYRCVRVRVEVTGVEIIGACASSLPSGTMSGGVYGGGKYGRAPLLSWLERGAFITSIRSIISRVVTPDCYARRSRCYHLRRRTPEPPRGIWRRGHAKS